MKLTACLIVKDEEEILERCLSSICDYVDEIVIANTWSNDKTFKIAQEFTDEIYEFKWCDDFAKARNFCQSKATGDYILWMDADEYFNKVNIESLKKKLDSIDKWVLFIDINRVNIIDGKMHNTEQKTKVIKNHWYKWIWKIHEIIDFYSSDPIYSILLNDVKFFHELTIEWKNWNNIHYFIELFPQDTSNMTIALKILNYYLAKDKIKDMNAVVNQIPYIHPKFIWDFVKFAQKLELQGFHTEKKILDLLVKKSIIINKKLYT